MQQREPSGAPAPPEVIRNAAWVHREYGADKWPPLLADIERLAARGERSLARAVATIRRRDWGPFGVKPFAAAALGAPVTLPNACAFLGYDGLIAETVIAACRPDTDAVIELGAGWGRSLFSVWLNGGPRAAHYAGLELTEAGIGCMRRLAALEPDLKLTAAPFDFQAPTFPSLGPIRHAVVFSVYGLHQVTRIGAPAYRALLKAAPAMDMLHVEPIGFQMNRPGPLTERSRAHALKNGYNLDMWEIVDDLRTAGDIDVIAAEADLFGFSEHYPASLVHWRKTDR